MSTLHSQTVKALDAARFLLDGAMTLEAAAKAEGFGMGWIVGLFNEEIIGKDEFLDATARVVAEGARRRDWIAAAEQMARRACA